MRFFQDGSDDPFVFGKQTQLGHGKRLGFLIQQTKAYTLSVKGGQGRDPDIKIALPLGEGNAPPLRSTFLRDIDPAHDLDARNDRILKTAKIVGDSYGHELAVNPVAYLKSFLVRFEMNVGGTINNCSLDNLVDETNDGRVLILEVIGALVFLIKVEIRLL